MPTRTAVRATLAALLALATGCQSPRNDDAAAADPTLAVPGAGLLYGRITTTSGDAYEGRLRFGGDEEALWGNQFNGRRTENRWADLAQRSLLPRERLSLEVLGVEVSAPGAPYTLARPFMARFGDIARIDPTHRSIGVTLKSGTRFDLNRYEADDLADGVRIWDATRGMVDLTEGRIASIEFLPAPSTALGPAPLHGTVHTAAGSFTGLLQWDRERALLTDQLEGIGAAGAQAIGFAEIAAIERLSPESARVTLHSGQVVELSGARNVGVGNRGVYVDDPRYGRVLVSWEAFQRAELSPAESAPGYGDFVAGHALQGTVVTKDGRRLAGRLVYDLDESETTETLDAPAQGVDYTLPFGIVASIAVANAGAAGATITLRSGEVLQLDAAGDLGPQHAGMLVFAEGAASPVYVSWSDVARVEFAQP